MPIRCNWSSDAVACVNYRVVGYICHNFCLVTCKRIRCEQYFYSNEFKQIARVGPQKSNLTKMKAIFVILLWYTKP